MTDTESELADPIELTEPTPVPVPDPTGLFWRFGFPALMMFVVVALVVLITVGRDAILQSTDGAREEQVTDPAAPGWEALTEPTPVMLVVHRDAAEKLRALTVLSLTGDHAGGVVPLPLATMVPGKDRSLSAVGEDDEAVRDAVEKVLGIEIEDLQVVSSSQWRELVLPSGSLTVSNPDDVFAPSKIAGRGIVRVFAKGELSLGPDDVAAYLELGNEGESDLNRLVRHGAFWRAWLQAVRRAGLSDALPGERDTGLGRFVPTLAAAPPNATEIATLPVRKQTTERNPGSTAEAFVVDPEKVARVVGRLVPFPVGPVEGARLHVRVLDGVGRLDHGLPAAAALVGAGAQIDRIGNAPTFGVATTTLAYREEADEAKVRAMAAALGVGEVVKDDGSTVGPDADVTVTLGRDFIEKGRTAPAGSTIPTTGGSGG